MPADRTQKRGPRSPARRPIPPSGGPVVPVAGSVTLLLLVLSVSLLVGATTSASAAGPTPGSLGAHAERRFTDSTGKIHTWTLSASSALLWDRRPWVPFGGIFCFHFLAGWDARDAAGNEARWSRDVKALQAIRTSGLTDILVRPGVPATSLPIAVWQRCLDELERMGFHYGIEIADGPQARLRGWWLGGAVRVEATSGSPASTRAPGVEVSAPLPGDPGEAIGATPLAALALTLDPASGEAARVETVQAGKSGSPRSARYVLDADSGKSGPVEIHVVQEIEYAGPRGPRDVWGGMDEYASRLRRFLEGLRLGPGFRFVAEPIAGEALAAAGADAFLPASRAFLDGYETWLKGAYGGRIDDLRAAWGIAPGSAGPREFAEAASLVPVLPAKSPGARDPAHGHAVDPGTGRATSFDPRASLVRADLAAYRDASLRALVARIADEVKAVLDVPVVALRDGPGLRPWLANDQPDGAGLDGLLAGASAAGTDPILDGVSYGLAEIRASARPMWLLAMHLCPAPPGHKAGKPIDPPGRAPLSHGLDLALEVGARGLVFDSFRLPPAPTRGGVELSRATEGLRWEREARDDHERDSGFAARVASVAPLAVSWPAPRAGMAAAEGGPWEESGPCAPWPSFRLPGGTPCVPSSEPPAGAGLAIVRAACLGRLTSLDRAALRRALDGGWPRVVVAGTPPGSTGITEIDALFGKTPGPAGAQGLAPKEDSAGSRVLVRGADGKALSIQTGRFVVLADPTFGADFHRWREEGLPRALGPYDVGGVGSAAARAVDRLRRGSPKPETLLPSSFRDWLAGRGRQADQEP